MALQQINSTDIATGSALGSIGANNITATYLQTGAVETALTNNGTSFGMKNRIINGDMRIDQRNNGANSTPSLSTYTVDRWYVAQSPGSKLTVGKNLNNIAGPTGFPNYLGISTASAYTPSGTDQFEVFQWIEGYNSADLSFGTAAAKTVTLSFWVYTSLVGTFSGAIGGYNGSLFRNYSFTYSVPVANTWTKITVTIPGDTSSFAYNTTNGNGIYVSLNLGCGNTYLNSTPNTWSDALSFGVTGTVAPVATSGATFYVTGVQLEKGSVATTFDFRSYGTEWALCQRYYQVGRFVLSPFVYTNVTGSGAGTPQTSNVYCNEITLGVPLRIVGATITPCRYDKTVITNGTYVSRVTNEGDYSGLTNTNPYLRNTEPNTIFIYITTSNGWYPVPVYFTASAEL